MKKSLFMRMVLVAALAILPGTGLQAAEMNDYCIIPPFIQETIKPNLLMILDNSASMYDLAYPDKGKKRCSTTTTKDCTVNSDCPTNETCSIVDRNPFYCFDESYKSTNTYVGYFRRQDTNSNKLYYNYSLTDGNFVETTTFSCTAAGGQTSKKTDTNELCVIYDTTSPHAIRKFMASGNYLNWLTSSKFDVQKQILTGGKYTASNLLAESRGCVGQSFVKKAITDDFENFSSTNDNTSLGISFGIRGPYDSVNKSAPSSGGQTFIDIYIGDYNEQNCQDAVIALQGTNLADMKQAVCRCLTNDDQCRDISGTQTAVTKTKVAFQQTIQACWQCKPVLNLSTGHYTCSGHDIGTDEINTVKNQCTDVVNNFATCDNNPDIVCTTDSECGTGTCIYGPAAIVPGNPALLCSSSYEGQYFYLASGSGVCKKNNNPDMGACTSDDDCTSPGYKCVGASIGGWQVKSPEPTADMQQTHRDFCGAFQQPLVIDPTDSPSDTTVYDNVPAILSGIGVEAQLSQPIASLSVKVKWHDSAKSPEGLLQEFNDKLRIGLMTFNFNGAKTETGTTIPLQKVCSTDTTKTCANDIDCPTQAAGTCVAAVTVSNSYISDGAKIIHDVGKGMCEGTTTVCTTSANCSSGKKCIIRDQDKLDLVNELNSVTAKSWTPFAEAFYNAIGYYSGRTDLRVNTNDFDTSFKPSEYRCQANNILFVSDGMSTADQYPDSNTVSSTYTSLITGDEYGWSTGCVPPYGGSKNIDTLSWIGKNKKISVFSKTDSSVAATPVDKKDTVATYVVFNGTSNGLTGECNSETLLSKTAANGGTGMFKAELPDQFTSTLRNAFLAIASGSASATAASILNNSEGSGANLLQAVFYPQKDFENRTVANWIGELQNLWYYVDPFANNSTVREDTDFATTTPYHILDVKKDYVVDFKFVDTQTTVSRAQDTNGDGLPDGASTTVSPDDVKSLWRAGKQLWAKSSASRRIHTSVDGTTLLAEVVADKGGFFWDSSHETNATTLIPYLQAADKAESEKIISFVRGTDQTGYRNRRVSILTTSPSTYTVNEWKLGDIISSTPRLQSSNALNSFGQISPTGYSDKSYSAFTRTDQYKKRGMVYVSANDGMLHAFKLGKLTISGTSDAKKTDGTTPYTISGDVKATLTGTDLGEEQWAYIPRNALPYLKYLADQNYPHLYTVDGSTVLSDVATGRPSTCTSGIDYSLCERDKVAGTNWRTVLIGSMGWGGASSLIGSSCVEDSPGTCVKTPVADPSDAAKGVGYSSYFAFDVTDQYFNTDGTLHAQPVLKWEFSPTGLGYATSGATIVRIGKVTDKNGKWFAIMASGPTGPIDKTGHQFLGKSDQNLKIFVVDLGATAPLVQNTNYWVIDTGIKRAFGGNIVPGVIDTDRWNSSRAGNYSDDAIYIGYTKASIDDAAPITATTTWSDGGVVRILTKEDQNPANWVASTVISGIGPVSSGIVKMQDRKVDNKKLWLYFGTGRYFHKTDDHTNIRYLMGIQEGCYKADDTLDPNCETTSGAGKPLALSDLVNQSTSVNSLDTNKGWYIKLPADDSANELSAHRSITDAVAVPSGMLLYTSFAPTSDVCKFGGETRLWSLRYDTGGLPLCASLTGKILIQMSTGSFEQQNLSDIFACDTGSIGTPGPIKQPGLITILPVPDPPGGGGDYPAPPSPPIPGMPPLDPPTYIFPGGNSPLKKLIHIQEK